MGPLAKWPPYKRIIFRRVSFMQKDSKQKVSKKVVETLDWSYASLLAVPDELPRYKRLINLRLDNNNLENIPWEIFMGLEDLETVNLAANKISTLPEILEHWKSIQVLDLSFNKIVSVPVCLYTFFFRFDLVVRLHRGPDSRRGIPEFNCDWGVKDLRTKYGRKLPEEIEWKWSFEDWPESRQTSGMVKVSEEHFIQRDTQTCRLRLEGNPIADRLPAILGKQPEWASLLEEWQKASAKEKNARNRIVSNESAKEKRDEKADAWSRKGKERTKDVSRKHEREGKMGDF
jgi:hypothetical protein